MEKEVIIELETSKMIGVPEEEVKKYVDGILWEIISNDMNIEDKSFKSTEKIEESDVYIYSPGWTNWSLPDDMEERLNKARKLGKRIVRFEILDIDRMPDRIVSKIRITEEQSKEDKNKKETKIWKEKKL